MFKKISLLAIALSLSIIATESKAETASVDFDIKRGGGSFPILKPKRGGGSFPIKPKAAIYKQPTLKRGGGSFPIKPR